MIARAWRDRLARRVETAGEPSRPPIRTRQFAWTRRFDVSSRIARQRASAGSTCSGPQSAIGDDVPDDGRLAPLVPGAARVQRGRVPGDRRPSRSRGPTSRAFREVGVRPPRRGDRPPPRTRSRAARRRAGSGRGPARPASGCAPTRARPGPWPEGAGRRSRAARATVSSSSDSASVSRPPSSSASPRSTSSSIRAVSPSSSSAAARSEEVARAVHVAAIERTPARSAQLAGGPVGERAAGRAELLA